MTNFFLIADMINPRSANENEIESVEQPLQTKIWEAKPPANPLHLRSANIHFDRFLAKSNVVRIFFHLNSSGPCSKRRH